MTDQWVAGFAHGVSAGATTEIRRSLYGPIDEGEHDFLWQMGLMAGVSTSFLLGSKVPGAMEAKLGGANWAAAWWVGTTGSGAMQGLNGLTDGHWQWNDVFNLLSLFPLAAPASTSISNSLATARGANALSAGDEAANVRGVNQTLRDSRQTSVNLTSKCFVAGTEILTTEGEKNIEDIEVGDWVVADDPTTPGEIEARQILDTFVRRTEKLVDLYVDGEVISTTGEHPFWTPDKGWVEAKDLTVGSLLQTEDGRIIDVDGIEEREGEFEVYNFKVEGFHTYFVSQHHLLVHNADCTSAAKKFRRNRPGGEIISIRPANGGVLPDPPNMRLEDAPWFYHDVYMRDGLVYDTMGFGDELGGAGIPYDEWIQVYGGPDNLIITKGPTR